MGERVCPSCCAAMHDPRVALVTLDREGLHLTLADLLDEALEDKILPTSEIVDIVQTQLSRFAMATGVAKL